jgi:hypothetical protein
MSTSAQQMLEEILGEVHKAWVAHTRFGWGSEGFIELGFAKEDTSSKQCHAPLGHLLSYSTPGTEDFEGMAFH